MQGVNSLSDIHLQLFNPQLYIPTHKQTHSREHTPCVVFSYAQLLMDKQRAVNCDGLSADIFPSHILEVQETYTRVGTVKREEKLKVKLSHRSGYSHACAQKDTTARQHTAARYARMCSQNRYKQTEDLREVQRI